MSNLLDKASILLTPTAYSSGDLHCIKPNTATGDFDFTRATTATRVGPNGLIQNVASGLPRIDFLGGTGHILLEPASTNTATYSNDFSQGDIFNGSGNPTLTGSILSANQGTAPDGTNTAQKLIDNNDGSSGSVTINFFSTNLTSATDSTISVFAKKDGANVLRINITGFDNGRAAFFNLANGTKSGTAQSTIEDFGNGWFKCSVTMNTTTDLVGAVLFNICNDSNQTSILRNGNQSILLWGMQSEEQSFPTSYLPTSGGFVSRNKDEANNSGDTSLISSTEGVLYAEIAALADDSIARHISINSNNNNNSVDILYSTGSNKLQFRVTSNNSSDFLQATTLTDRTQFAKAAIKYKSGDIKCFVNGSEVFSDTSSFTFTESLQFLNLKRGGAGGDFEGKAKCVAVFKEALTDAELIALTS